MNGTTTATATITTTISGATMAVAGSLTPDTWLGIIGVTLAAIGGIGGLWINIWRSRKMVAIEQQRFDLEFPKKTKKKATKKVK